VQSLCFLAGAMGAFGVAYKTAEQLGAELKRMQSM